MTFNKNKGNNILWVLLGVMIGIILLLVLVKRFKSNNNRTIESPKKEILVKVMNVMATNFIKQISLPAVTEPFQDIIISAEASGSIIKVNYDKGARVDIGDVLINLDDKVAKQIEKQSLIEKEESLKEFTRWVSIKDIGGISDSDYDKVKIRKELAEIALTKAQVALSHTKIVTPISGVVDERYKDEGEYVKIGDPLVRVVDTTKLKIRFNVPEKYIFSISVGDELTFVSPTLKRKFKGKVSFVSNAGNRMNNSYPVEMIFDNTNFEMKAGMIVEVLLDTKMLKDAIVIPLSAVVPHKGENIVFVIKNGEAIRRTVKIDSFSGTNVLIDDGVNNGDVLVVKGQNYLTDGARVRVDRSGSSE